MKGLGPDSTCVPHAVEAGRWGQIVRSAKASGMEPSQHPRCNWVLCATHGVWHPLKHFADIGIFPD